VALDARLATLFRDYADHHRNPMNVLLHKIAIPLIAFHIVAMLDWVHLVGPVTLAHVVYAAAVAWYLRLDIPMGLLMAVLYALLFPVARVTPWPLVVFIAGAAWSAQLVGHVVFEKKQPAFLHNLQHALVGPMFFVASALGRWPERSQDA
jgi:uncharacterized membrane protein YGL010W